MPTIRIDDQVWLKLKELAIPLEDTPNRVLRRQLGLKDTEPAAKTQLRRALYPGPKGKDRGESFEYKVTANGFRVILPHRGREYPTSLFHRIRRRFAGRTVLGAFNDGAAQKYRSSLGALLNSLPRFRAASDGCYIAGLLCEHFGVVSEVDDQGRVALHFPAVSAKVRSKKVRAKRAAKKGK